MNADQLAHWLEQRLPKISGINLDLQTARVTHVLNWGGFVNQSFSVRDAAAQYHLKITNDLDSANKLRRLRDVYPLLADRYRAPTLIDWMEFSEIGFTGMLMQHVDGDTAKFNEHPVLVGELIDLVSRLHRDGDVRSHLGASTSKKTYLHHFVETYIGRFTADLQIVAKAQLEFVPSDLLSWMWLETDRLRKMASARPAFQRIAVEPVHSDLNEGNVLVTPNKWFLVDWDDLAIGDPAIDMAVLLWPMVYAGREWTEFSIPDVERSFAERIEVCLRAQLLDEVIDPLADYIEAWVVPSRQDEVQLAKKSRHQEALKRYRETWSQIPS